MLAKKSDLFVMLESSILPPHNYSHNMHIQNVNPMLSVSLRQRRDNWKTLLPPPSCSIKRSVVHEFFPFNYLLRWLLLTHRLMHEHSPTRT